MKVNERSSDGAQRSLVLRLLRDPSAVSSQDDPPASVQRVAVQRVLAFTRDTAPYHRMSSSRNTYCLRGESGKRGSVARLLRVRLRARAGVNAVRQQRLTRSSAQTRRARRVAAAEKVSTVSSRRLRRGGDGRVEGYVEVY
ncbi:hypothetical protein EVAR_81901_1 [Eumeta japonica]|uniref:Uncharacterized protein n=1 Tax=Eumeta variegata TaxID=151549 RepID=A0A4C1UYH0_EUMVA|nr:hypothetical protein EVAR_81901_1 [Eumeta japonica]